jgi:fibronectin type 3 domain-containing protein
MPSSGRGPTADGRIKPDVLGPAHLAGLTPGTSQSAAFVAGVVLLMREASPSLTAQAVKGLVMSTAVDWGVPGPDDDTGAGRLDAYAALKAAGAPLTSGPVGPGHVAFTGTVVHGASAEFSFDVTNSIVWLDAMLTNLGLTAAAGESPDLDVCLYDPGGVRRSCSSGAGRQEQAFVPGATVGRWTARVRAVVGGGPFVVDVSGAIGTLPETPPGAPVLTATAKWSSVALKWTVPPATGLPVTGYRVYRGAAAGNGVLLAEVGPVAEFTDTTVVDGTTYYYAVSAVNAAGEGPRSLERAAAPPPFAPYESYSTAGPATAVAIGDVTGDGRNDVVAVTGFGADPPNDFKLRVFPQTPDGALGPRVSYGTAASYTQRPNSVAVGDVTGDGRPDVVLGVIGSGIEVFPQQPNGTLGPGVVTAAGGTLVRLGHLDADDTLDAVTVSANGANTTVHVLLNDGAGGFEAPVNYTAKGRADLEVADVTGDGRDDVLTYTGSSLSLLAQLPSGGLALPVEYPLGAQAAAGGIGVGDLTGDGRNDVVAADGGNGSIGHLQLFAQTPEGALATPVARATNGTPGAVEVADFDGDPRADAITLYPGDSRGGVFRSLADGSLGDETPISIPYGDYAAHMLTTGDISGDGIPEIVFVRDSGGLFVLRRSIPAPPAAAPGAPALTEATGRNHAVGVEWAPPATDGGALITGYAIYRSIGGGAKTLLTVVGPQTSFDDTTASNGVTYVYEVSALNRAGEGARSNALSATPLEPPAGVPRAPRQLIATAGDGTVALSWTAPTYDGGGPITGYRVYRSTYLVDALWLDEVPTTSFTDTVVNDMTYTYEVSAVTAAGEGPRSSAVAVMPVSPAPLFDPFMFVETPGTIKAIATGDVTGDGRTDIVTTTGFVVGNTADVRLRVYAQTVYGRLADPVVYPTAGTSTKHPTSVAIGDLTGDGRNDVAVGVEAVGVQVFPQLPNGTLGSPSTRATTNAHRIALGRLDGDADLDVVGIGTDGNTASVLLNDGTGSLGAPVTYTVTHGSRDTIATGDVTGDGRDDIIVTSPSVLAQLPGGGFAPAIADTDGPSEGLAVADLTGDGRNDLVGGHGRDAIVVRPQTPAGALGGAVVYPGFGSPGAVATGDLDGDNRTDVAALDTSVLVVRRGHSDGTLGAEERYLLPDGTPEGNRLALGDVNGDGRLDVVEATTFIGFTVLLNRGATAGAPAAPLLAPALLGDQSATLGWSTPAGNGSAVTGYRIYRRMDDGPEALLATLGPETTYTDEHVASRHTFRYTVSAVNASGVGPRSNERVVNGATVPEPPELLEAAAGDTVVEIVWARTQFDGGSAVTGYRIYRSDIEHERTLVATVNAGPPFSYRDIDAANGIEYRYVVTALNTVGESGTSNEIAATPVPTGRPQTVPPITIDPRTEPPPFTPPTGSPRPPRVHAAS